MSMKDKRKSRSELKRAAILQAAKSAFQIYGVQATSMDKLAELAQVSKRTVYNHFSTKEDLVMHLISELWNKSMVQADVVYQPHQPLDTQLTHLIEAEIELVGSQEYLDLVRVAFGHFFYHPDEMKQAVEKLKAQETALHRWLKAALKDGKLKPLDVEFAVSQLHNLVKGSCFWPQCLKIEPALNSEQKKHLATQTVALFLSYYKT